VQQPLDTFIEFLKQRSSITKVMSTSHITTLSEQSIQILRNRGDDARLQNGFRSVSNTSYLSEDSVDSQATVEIPDKLESVETLEFLELRPEVAQHVFNSFLQQKAEFPHWASIDGAARDHVRSIQGDAFYLHDDWSDVMSRIGLTANFQKRVMDPEYTHMRLTGSAKHWAIEMINMRFEFLFSLDNVIKSHAPGPKHKVSHMDLSGELKAGLPYPVSERSSSKGPVLGTFPSAGPSVATANDMPPVNIDGHQMFFKGGSLVRLNKIFTKTSRLNILQVCSTPPGDFTALSQALYLTKQTSVAWEHAQWAKKIVDGAVVPIGILKIAIPNSLLASITQVAGDEWRNLVWNSRRQDEEDDNLAYLKESQWLTGPLCRQSTNTILKMSTPAELEVWKLKGGETASQHYTASGSMFKMLGDACVDKVWITEMACSGGKRD
jgi:hypothetical protein